MPFLENSRGLAAALFEKMSKMASSQTVSVLGHKKCFERLYKQNKANQCIEECGSALQQSITVADAYFQGRSDEKAGCSLPGAGKAQGGPATAP
jgi:hypothetical protein